MVTDRNVQGSQGRTAWMAGQPRLKDSQDGRMTRTTDRLGWQDSQDDRTTRTASQPGGRTARVGMRSFV
jgi:hypothetical protein